MIASTLHIYTGLAAFFVFIGGYVLLALSRVGWRRWAGPWIMSVVYLAAAGLILLSLGAPRPLWTFAWSDEKARVLAYALDEPRAIYLWVLPEGQQVPVAVALPWSTTAAESVVQTSALLASEGQDGEFDLGEHALGWDTREPLIYPFEFPQELPAKDE